MLRHALLYLLFVVTTLSATAQTDSSRLRMEQGQVFAVEVTLNHSVTQQAMGQAIDFTVDGKASHSYQVTNASADFYTLHHEAQKMSFIFNGMGSKKTFDSENQKDLKGPWGDPVKKLLAKKYDMVLDPSGTLMKVSPQSFPAGQTDERLVLVLNMLKDLVSVTEPPKKGEAGFFKILPDSVHAVGDTWTNRISTSTETSTTTYKLDAMGDSTITVSFTGKGKSSVKAEMMGMESTTTLNSVTTGIILINGYTGIMLDKKSETVSTGTAEMMGNTTPVNAKSIIHTVVTPS